MAILDTVNRIFREFKRYTGDGLPGEPTGAALPIGDPQSGVHSPKKSELRAGFVEIFSGLAEDVASAEEDADRAETAATAAQAALSSIVTTSFATKAAAQAYGPIVAPDQIRIEGYTSAGDGGGALYKKVVSEPTHAGKFSITLDDAVTVVWYEIAETIIDAKMFGATGDGVTDDRAACQAAIDYLTAQGGGTLWFSSGDYLINSTASADVGTYGLDNGLLIPFAGYDVEPRIVLVGVGASRILAGSDDMILIRACQPGTEVNGLIVDGRCEVGGSPASGFTNVWGIGFVAEDRADDTFLASQSFVKVIGSYITQCIEAIVMEPGPNVGSSEAGMFYPVVSGSNFNFNKRSIWCKPPASGDNNRPTRGTIQNNRFTRGQGGIDLEYASEINLGGNKFEFMLGATYGTDLRGFGYAIYAGEFSAFNWSVNDFMEQCDRWFALHVNALPYALQQHGNPQAGVNSNNNFTHRTAPYLIQMTRRTSAYEQLQLQFHHAGWARIVADWTGSNVRDLNVEISGTRRTKWHAGGIDNFGGTHIWYGANSTSYLAVLVSSRLSPGDDNLKTLGLGSERWSVVYSATGTIDTSDLREKLLRDGQAIGPDLSVSPLLLSEVAVGKALAKQIGLYKWKEAVETKGDGARLHVGVTAQGVMKAFEDEGLDPFAYGVVCYDEWGVDEVTGAPAGNRYGLRYNELWGFVAAGFEARLSALEG